MESLQISSEILTEKNKQSLPPIFPSKPHVIPLDEQENLSPKSQNLDSEPKKVPLHLRYNRIRALPLRTTPTNKGSKLLQTENNMRSLIKKSNEKQLIHSQSLQTIAKTQSSQPQYPTLLTRKSSKYDVQQLNDCEFQQIVDVSLKNQDFGEVFPGGVYEKELCIRNKSTHNIVIRVSACCNNEIFNSLDEYVFSVAKIDKYDFNEKILLILPANAFVKIRLALKVPKIKEKCLVQGTCSVEIMGIEKIHSLSLIALVKIPKLTCEKEIFDRDFGVFVLKFAIKRGKKMDFKVFLRNESENYLEGNFEILGNSVENEVELLVFPCNTIINPHSTLAASLLIKDKNSSLKNISNFTVINKILLFKVRNSSLIYFFALAIEIYS